MNTDFALYSQFDQVVSHFDGNNRDPDDIAGLPVAAALIRAADLQDKSTFFYNNNVGQPNVRGRVETMREGAAFAETLGIETYDYQEDMAETTQKLVDIFNSGKQILVLEGGRMEMTYRALELTDPGNLSNITLLSHSSANEDYDLGGTRTWSDLQRDFSQVAFRTIIDQNGGFNSSQWQWLDNTTDPLLQEVRSLMQNAERKVDDPSDAGMHFYALTGDETGDPIDAKNFFNTYLSPQGPIESVVAPTPDPVVPLDPTPEPVSPPVTLKPTVPVDSSLITLALVNANNGEIVQGYEDLSRVSQIDPNALGIDDYSLIARPSSSAIKSVKFETAAGDRIENVKPYTLFGDRKGTITGQVIDDGDYQVKVTGYSEANGGGQMLSILTVDYKVRHSSPRPDDAPSIHDVTHENVSPTTDLGVVGSSNLYIVGTDGNDTLVGDGTNQKIVGGRGKDRLVGVDESAHRPGLGEQDVLIGGIGADRYVLGNTLGAFYDDGDIGTSGLADFAEIRGFSERQDIIELHGVASDYRLGATTVRGKDNLGIFLTSGEDELIAVLKDSQQKNLSFESSAFEFVS
ncbi:hypothetical protein S7335_4931 [Synechococcus sp. PCC 7335]|uniref:calcium-binding protein n=1 Tax=Synechococcus sp. (strain ATCC 29403 / PCC 7335) TaxID=91464 RepID=UPI00017ED61C|nr:calcium-binding protein [Synechococcus sp. PCC 7335]EDX87224.1 hypothetical protein S7335_4931 [Synechococcus sp. PCC 7335]